MGTSKKQKKREWLRYRDFVLSPYGVIKIKSLGYIKVEQVLDAVGMSRSNLEKRFKDEMEQTIHGVIHAKKLERAHNLLVSTSLSINEISVMYSYPSLPYFYAVFRKEYDLTPKEYRDRFGEEMNR